MRTRTLPAAALAIGLTGALTISAAPAQAAVPAAAGPIHGCALLGAAKASKILGSPAHATHETNTKGPAPLELNRGCIWAFSDNYFGYNVNTFKSAATAKSVYNQMKTATLESTLSDILQGSGNVKVKGYPGFVRVHQVFPALNEPPIVKDCIYNVVVRKGATLFVTSFAADNLESTAMLLAAAKVIVPRM
ncbi:MAG: hypothetical protein WCP28_09305 [Actinomycetes bacterium]